MHPYKHRACVVSAEAKPLANTSGFGVVCVHCVPCHGDATYAKLHHRNPLHAATYIHVHINILQVISVVILSTIILAYASKKCLRPPTYPATDLCPPWLHEADKVLLKAISWALVYTHPGHTSSESIQAAGRQAGIWSTLDCMGMRMQL